MILLIITLPLLFINIEYLSVIHIIFIYILLYAHISIYNIKLKKNGHLLAVTFASKHLITFLDLNFKLSNCERQGS